METNRVPRKTEAIARLRDEVCHYCKTAPGATLDHIVPDLFGGAYMLWNLVPACQPCNHAKGSSWPTCPCDKCQASIARHVGDPVFRMKVETVLDRQERSLAKNVRLVKEQAEKLESNLSDFRDYRQGIRAHLTDHTFESKVDA